MRPKYIPLIMALLLLPALACSGILGGNSGNDTTESASSSASLSGQAPTPTLPPTAAAAAAEANSEPSESSSADSDQLAAQEEPPAESSDQMDSAGNGDGPSSFVGIIGLDNLSSYRMNFVMDFEGTSGGQPSKGQVVMDVSVTKDPPARHIKMTMEGSTVEQLGGSNTVEIYQVADTVYMYTAAAGGEWISMSAEGMGNGLDENMFLPEEDLVLPDTADCGSTTTTVNGVEAYSCTFGLGDVSTEDVTFDNLSGQAWVAADGNYVVKYIFEAQGYSDSSTSGPGLFDTGNVTYEYNLTEINADFEITVPEEALSSQSLDLGGMAGGGAAGGDSGGGDNAAAGDMPTMPDATELTSMAGFTSYYTAAGVSQVVEFYRQELPALGWTEDESAGFSDDTTGLLSFENDGNMMMLTISAEGEGRTNVGLMVAPQ